MCRTQSVHSFLLFVYLSCSAFLLNGCAAAHYGVSEQNWKTLSSAQKKKMKADYRRIVSARAKEKQEQDRQRITPTTPKIMVEIEGGEALMPPFAKSAEFDSVSVLIYQGHCQSVVLQESDGEKKTDLEACYLGKVLYLDPSKTEFQWHQGSLQFHYNPIWDSESGFVYNNISSQGYAGLKNTTIRVKSLLISEQDSPVQQPRRSRISSKISSKISSYLHFFAHS